VIHNHFKVYHYPKDDCFTGGSMSSLTTHTAGTKIRFIDFDFTG